MKPRLTFWQIVNMNVGFFGIQFSFGLQQSNMSPIYKYLGADEATLPLLWLAGPMTGLLLQPVIGAISDRTITHWGRRTPYFLAGAILCSLALLAMPFSPTLWMAASVLWILDAANNITMEPYRAFVSDKLQSAQYGLGFLTQSALTGFGQTLAYLTPSLLVLAGVDKDAINAHNIPHITIAAFLIGAFFSLSSVAWTLVTTREIRLSPAQVEEIRGRAFGWRATLREIVAAFRQMPPTMRQLAVMNLFQWYALFCYWQYIVLCLAKTMFGTSDPASAGFRDAGLLNGQIGAVYNFIAFVAAFALVPFVRRAGPRRMHFACLALAGASMLAIPEARDKTTLFLLMIGIGLAWASIMGNPYVMLARSIPPERTGIYMGIFNMFIVIPMMIQIFTIPLLYAPALGGRPENVIRLAGGLMLCAAIAVLFVRMARPDSESSPRTAAPAAH
jgi:maltose/moltooligosaccharide transporter